MSRWYISGPSFIYMRHIILEFWYFKRLLNSKKVPFQGDPASKKHPQYGRLVPHSSLCPFLRVKANCLGWQWKNPSFIAFSKLFLFHVKVEILLNSWHFFMAFLYTLHSPLKPLPPSLNCHPHFYCQWKVLRWHISGPSFIYKGHVFLEFWYLKCSFSSKKVLFQAASG